MNIKKIAVISSSPMMMMLSLELSKKSKVTIFESSKKIGGAWAWFDNKKGYLPKYSNAIVPLNKKEERFIPLMNKILKKKYKIKVKQTKKKIITNFPFKKKFIYDFSNFYNTALKKLKFTKKFINEIEILKNGKVLLNKKYKFDKVYLPSMVGVEKIKIRKKIYKPLYKVIVSEHISIIAKKFKIKNFYYSDFYDENFDRLKIDKGKNFFFLTARLTYARKGSPISKIKKYIKKFVNEKDIIRVKKSKFKNYYRNEDRIKLFKNIVKNSNIKYVDTTQFLRGFLRLRNFFKN